MTDGPLLDAAGRRAAADALEACRDAERRLTSALGELRTADRTARDRWTGLGAHRFAADADAAERELADQLGALTSLARRIDRGLTTAEVAARRLADAPAAGVRP